MLLAVDVGNTKIKSAVFKDTALLGKYIFSKNDAPASLENIFDNYTGIAVSILSVVGATDASLLQVLERFTHVIQVTQDSAFPFTNRYATPQTLGVDRMVLAAGATLCYPGRHRLVIDAGTCITYDFIDADDNYLGGAISPGIRLRYEALHNFTAKLPLLSAEVPQGFTGNSTGSSIHSGVINGLLYEMQGFIRDYEEKYGDLTIILTGGDADFLAKQFKSTIFANSNFLLESLNYLYLYQSRND
ncbi:pantothenate kinase [Flavobacterium cyanobacteriorum]|uniref:Type III pantothenate kinase n=1 Tax=Flavobacterium cyanobacteriorum TaxID=2022802 RepID=A0A255YYX2_9FLAO|nr:type III pantothenate kinase [Flavobacterium cyanobacteriorum]OYQ34392.1 pantothenate kinase [Flavobacterium cyanobacteriorum]